jgi:hypothetical protein
MRPVVKLKLPNVDVGNGFIVESAVQGKAGTQATYRAIKKELANRKGEKHRIIWLIKSFLVYRVK